MRKPVAPAPASVIADKPVPKKKYVPPPAEKDPPGKLKKLPDGGKIGKMSDGKTVKLLPPRKPRPSDSERALFDNFVHGMMACYSVPGESIPPMPPLSDEEALAACMHPVKDDPDDTPADREKKAVVREMLAELKDYLKNGRRAAEYFAALQARQNLEADAVSRTRYEVNALITEGKIDEARATLDAYNAYLAEKNIPPVHIQRLTDYENANAEGSK